MNRPATLIPLGSCLLFSLFSASAGAETKHYALEIPAGQAVRYELELEPRHAGTLGIHAEWSGSRQLAIKLEPPAGITMRRNGPSPQHVEMTVDRQALATRATWRLSVRSPSGRESGEGLLTVELPSAPPLERPGLRPAPALVDPWAAWRMPDGAPRSWLHFDDRAHGLRDVLLAEERPDACRWQTPLLDYLDRSRRAMIEDAAMPSSSTRGALQVIAAAIDKVEQLRTTTDPFVVGPVPDEPRRREAYLRLRSQQLAPLENELDRILLRIGRDHAPDLADEVWPVRFVSCLTACERHFAEAPLVGADEATNAGLAREQWDRLVEAARTLDALAEVAPAP